MTGTFRSHLDFWGFLFKIRVQKITNFDITSGSFLNNLTTFWKGLHLFNRSVSDPICDYCVKYVPQEKYFSVIRVQIWYNEIKVSRSYQSISNFLFARFNISNVAVYMCVFFSIIWKFFRKYPNSGVTTMLIQRMYYIKMYLEHISPHTKTYISVTYITIKACTFNWV